MTNQKRMTLKEIAALTGCKLHGNPDCLITGVADLETATTQDASFYSNSRYENAMKLSKAGVIFIDETTTPFENQNFLITNQPSVAFQQLIDTFHPVRRIPSGFVGIHPSAVVHETAHLSNGVSIGPYAVIDADVKIGPNTFIGAGSYIGPDTTIGEECLIHPRVVIRENCLIGNRVIIQPGAVIGSCGFGYVTNKEGCHIKLNQVGSVRIEDDVEIGANTTIDRARFKCTRIGKGSKIDNLVQIGHGVALGNHNIIVSQTGIAGSTTLGNYVVIGGQTGVGGHLKLGNQVMVAAKSGVSKSLPSGKYGGIPAIPLNEYNRHQVHLRNIHQLIESVKELKQRIASLTPTIVN